MDSNTQTALINHFSTFKTESKLMVQCLDKQDLKSSVLRAYDIVSRLRTSDLAPKLYYELYLEILDALIILEARLITCKDHDVFKMLYKEMQCFEYVLPRVYILIVIAAS